MNFLLTDLPKKNQLDTQRDGWAYKYTKVKS